MISSPSRAAQPFNILAYVAAYPGEAATHTTTTPDRFAKQNPFDGMSMAELQGRLLAKNKIAATPDLSVYRQQVQAIQRKLEAAAKARQAKLQKVAINHLQEVYEDISTAMVEVRAALAATQTPELQQMEASLEQLSQGVCKALVATLEEMETSRPVAA